MAMAYSRANDVERLCSNAYWRKPFAAANRFARRHGAVQWSAQLVCVLNWSAYSIGPRTQLVR